MSEHDEFIAAAALVVTEEGELDLLLPYEFPADPSDPVYFLFAVHFQAVNDPEFYDKVMGGVRNNPAFIEFLESQKEETVH